MIVKNEQDEIQNYLSDASNYKGMADTVYLPENEQEIIDLIKKFNKEKTKVTLAGNGTGLTGGRVPEGGVVISLEKLNKILEINEEKKYVIVQPGVILKDLQEFVEEKKLFYPPDPTERNCFIGATVSTNSSGARTFKYGPTRNYVLAIRLVLPNGETVEIERGREIVKNCQAEFVTKEGTKFQLQLPKYEMPNTKNAAGYFCKENMDLIDLFIGAEGTLGIITEIKLQLIDFNDRILSLVVFFENEDDAFNFIDEARSLSQSNEDSTSKLINARGLEFFDHLTLNFLRSDFQSIPQKTCAVWFEQELGNNDEAITDAWLNLIVKHNADPDKAWIAFDKKEQEKFKDFRHAIALKVNEVVARRGLKKVGTDVSVPVESFRSFYKWMIKLVEENKMEYVVYGHFGNCHPHLNILPKDEDDFVKSKVLYKEICKEAVRLKGTVSAEHGIGKMKREYLLMMYGEDVVKQMAKLKLAFDPNKILNIGNIFYESYFD